MQVRRILAAVDLSTASPKAVLAGAELAAVAKAELLVFSAIADPWRLVEPGEIEGFRRTRGGSFAGLAVARVTDRLRELAASAAASAPAVSYRTAFGVPSIEIARCAEQEQADLIVLGRSAREPARDGPESITTATLRRSRVPVLIAPATHRVYARIVACIDDSPSAPTVLEAAQTIADCFGAQAVALHIVPSLTPPVGAGQRPRWLQRLERAGGTVVAPCETLVRQGDPATEILAEASRGNADLLVLGYRRGAGAGEAAECVGLRVLRLASCAVLAVPV